MASILSPLRYPGSKRRLANYIAETIELNGLHPNLFVEPFAGGASVSLKLLQTDKVQQVGLADKDPLISSFWETVFWDTEWLVRKIKNIDVTIDQWKRFRYSNPSTRRGQALKCIFLNRTCFSGIIAPGTGPIGGLEQKSQYKIDCRFPRENIIQRIRQAQRLADRVKFVWNTTWKDTLTKIAELCEQDNTLSNIFYYFDPPFFYKANKLYTYWFNASDHVNLRDDISKITDPWIISYDSISKVKELYATYKDNGTKIKCLYSISKNGGFRQAEEAIITNLKMLPTKGRLWENRKRIS